MLINLNITEINNYNNVIFVVNKKVKSKDFNCLNYILNGVNK